MIGIGIDAVEVARFRDVLARTPSIAGRLFTSGERAYADGHAGVISLSRLDDYNGDGVWDNGFWNGLAAADRRVSSSRVARPIFRLRRVELYLCCGA